MNLCDFWIEELKWFDQRLVENNRQVWRQSERACLETLELILQPVTRLQEVSSFCFDALAELIDLSDVDQAGIKVRFQ